MIKTRSNNRSIVRKRNEKLCFYSKLANEKFSRMEIYGYTVKRKVKRKIMQILHFNKLFLKYPIVIETLDRQKIKLN